MDEGLARMKRPGTMQDEDSQVLHEKAVPTSKWAKISLLCGLATWAVCLVGILVGIHALPILSRIAGTRGWEEWEGNMCFGFAVLVNALMALGLVTGLVALATITTMKLKKVHVRGAGIALAGISSALLPLGLEVMFFVSAGQKIRRLADFHACHRNIHSLGEALSVYAADNNKKYPVPDRWCDLLLRGGYASQADFKCPAIKQERCGYGINPNAHGNSPAEMVVLFETNGGWNQFGGPELLATGHHKNRAGGFQGCHILFNSMQVRYVELKEIPNLIWSEKQNASAQNSNR